MKRDNNIQHIRELLEKYYLAETTREEEERLEAFFVGSYDSDIPEDLMSDRTYFTAMQELHPKLAEDEVPRDLIEKLDGIIELVPKNEQMNRTGKRGVILRYVSIAAAACIAIAVFFKLPTYTDSLITPSAENIADAKELIISKPPTMDETALLTQPEVDSKLSEENVHQNYTNKELASYGESDQTDGFVEITDPEEVRKIAEEIGNLLAHSATKSSEAIAQLSNSIESYKEITKTILQ